MYSLTPSEHCEVVKAVVEETDGQVPVISGTGFNRQIGIALAQQAANVGVDASLALPPYYPNSDDRGLTEYYAAIGAATPLPLFVYSRDWVNPAPAWVEELAVRVPTLFGWKDGQGDIRRYQQIISRVGDRLYWIGGVGTIAFRATTALESGPTHPVLPRWRPSSRSCFTTPHLSEMPPVWVT